MKGEQGMVREGKEEMKGIKQKTKEGEETWFIFFFYFNLFCLVYQKENYVTPGNLDDFSQNE